MRKLLTTLTFALLLSVASRAQVSDYSQLRTNSWSLYGIGGISAATGDRLYKNVNASPDTYVAPMAGAGLTYNIRPWVRLNLGYEVSKYRREQSWNKVQADGLSYQSLEVLYNDVDLTVDFNLAQIFRKKGTSGRFNLYLGSGAGAMFAKGCNYTITMGESETVDSNPMNDNYTFNAWLKANNYNLGRDAMYIPLNLSAEYDITPRFTVGLRANGRYILDDNCKLLPTVTTSLGAVVRYNIVGRKQGYTSKAKQISHLQSELESITAKAKELSEKNEKLNNDLVAEQKTNKNIQNVLDDVKESLDNCGADKETVARLRQEIRDLKAQQYIVYFDNASDKIGRKGMATIADAAEKINSDSEALMVITASCSTPGSESYNKDLSDRRASAVREALIAKGVSAERITDIISLGKEGMTSSADCRRVIIDVK